MCIPQFVISFRGCIDQQTEVRRRSQNKRRDKNTKITNMDSLEKDTRRKYRNAFGGLSCCILLVLFVLSNPELYASKSGRFETRVLANNDKMQVSNKKVSAKKKDSAKKVSHKHDETEEENNLSEMPPNSIDKLMRKFDETTPDISSIQHQSKCLQKVKHTRPTIFLSLGRSGSTVILHRLNAMTNSQSNTVATEFVGQNLVDNLYFFDTTIPVKDKFKERMVNHIPGILKKSHADEKDVPGLNHSKHGQWLINAMCHFQQMHPEDLVGMKWKPNFEQFMERKEARETLQFLASLAANAPKDQPPIVSIRSRRNTLDVQLSNVKHYQHQGLDSRCEKGDDACLEQHKQKVLLPDVQRFYANVHATWQQENIFDELLVTLKIPHVTVSYEGLFYPDNVDDGEEDWNNMLQMISPGAPRESWDDIQSSMPFASTSLSRNHKELIENWEEVYDVFQGTEIEHLFRLYD